jgi:3-methylcrotonyl-CoA carboxylase alpha subunit
VAEVTPLGNGRYLLGDATRQTLAYAIGPPDARWVFLDGRVYVIDATESTVRRGSDEELALAAPMPAKVAAVKVEVGQQVARGEVLIMLEAMKMELPIRAPRDGRIASVACKAGEVVQPGTRLVELERERQPAAEPEHQPGTRNTEA